MTTALLRQAALWEAASGRVTATGRTAAPTITVAQQPVVPGSALYSVILELLDTRVLLHDDALADGSDGTVRIAPDVEQRSCDEPSEYLSTVCREAYAAVERRAARTRIGLFLRARAASPHIRDHLDGLAHVDAPDYSCAGTLELTDADLRTALDL